jgi:hypothetical protein
MNTTTGGDGLMMIALWAHHHSISTLTVSDRYKVLSLRAGCTAQLPEQNTTINRGYTVYGPDQKCLATVRQACSITSRAIDAVVYRLDGLLLLHAGLSNCHVVADWQPGAVTGAW